MSVSRIERSEIINREFKANKQHLPALHSDFLALSSLDGYYQTEKFYFFRCRMYGMKEVRYHKESRRVSVSDKLTHL